MPSTSLKQRRLFGIIRAIQKGLYKTNDKKLLDMANNIPAEKVKLFASLIKLELLNEIMLSINLDLIYEEIRNRISK